MRDSYFLPIRKARLCRRFGMVFLIAAALCTIALMIAMGGQGVELACKVTKPCVILTDSAAQLTERERMMVAGAPHIRAALDAWSARPWVRVGLAALIVIETGPIVIILLAVGLALRRLGARGDHALASAIPWLKHAARAGVFWAIASIFTHGLRTTLLSPALGDVDFPVDTGSVPLALLLAAAAYASAWALEAGIRAERDLADFV